MEFHISCHHTPDNCAVHRSESPMTKSWADHCKEVGVTFIKGGVNAPQHNHLMQPFIGYWDVVITPVMDLP